MGSVSVDVALQVGGFIVTAVILVVGMKFVLNGVVGDISEIKGDLKKLLASDSKQNERLAAVETEADAKSGWIRRVEEGLNALRKLVERRSES